MGMEPDLTQPVPFLFAPQSDFPSGDGSVAIITRASRPGPFLARCLESVRNQTYQNISHVIVLNGPDVAHLESALQGRGRNLAFIRSGAKLNRPMAANFGLESSDSEFVLLLDDDDSLEPSAIEDMVGFLRDPANRLFGGVACWVEVQQERLNLDGSLLEVGRESLNSWMRHVGLVHLARTNCIFTNGFLYRRAAQLGVGHYNPALPVVEDWEFNLRFLLRFEIGVVPKVLAKYHIRIGQTDEMSGNSLVAAQSLHERYDRMVRNSVLRKSLETPELQALAAVLSLGRLQYETALEIDRIQRTIDTARSIWRKSLLPIYRFFRSLFSWTKRK
jgi:glycosyltransferase involved in cell wall biosynthesis